MVFYLLVIGDLRLLTPTPKRGFMHIIKNGTVMDKLQVVQELNKYIPSSEEISSSKEENAPDVPVSSSSSKDAPVSSLSSEDAHEAPSVEPEDDVPREREICRSPKRRKLEPKEEFPEKSE